ncbi:Uncharacterized protein PHSC3_001116 [Chlamydiales bacterium STE3]|nr:Uncharacterized protein PHSC3_001116 [Chlamydiales bacterium STE3]
MSAPRVDLDTVNLAGVSTPVYAEYDYTHSTLAQEYYNNILALYNVYNKGVTYSNGSTTPDPIDPNRLTQADVDAVVQALANLKNLAENGAVLNNTPDSTKQYYLTKTMVTNLDLLLRSFNAVGVADPSQTMTLDDLNRWKDVSVLTPVIGDTLRAASNELEGNRSIQALIELIYVKAGSDLIGEKLGSLDSALNLTNDVLTTLGNIQSLKNQITVYDRGSIPFNYNGRPPNPGSASAGDYRDDYGNAASTHFGAPVIPTVPSTLIVYDASRNPIGLTAAGLSAFNKLYLLRQSVMNQIARVSAQSSTAEINNPQSLLSKLKQIQSDFDSLFARLSTDPNSPIPVDSTFTGQQKASALTRWIMDNYDKRTGTDATLGGAAQQNITLAITSAQSLNDTQKEEVRRFLFVFEEYYKSASAMLQAITQIVQKMAQGISK